jgi:hypothetical protein
MSSKQIATVVAIVLLLSAFSLVQSQSGQAPASSATQDKTSKQKPISSGDDRVITIVLPSGVAPVAVPDDAGAWAVQINSGGGFAPTRWDSITVTSGGDVACDGAKSSAGNLLPTNLEVLSQLVAAVRLNASTSDHADQRPTSMCGDCYGTTLTLSRREADHKVKTYMTTWDTVTRAHAPKDLNQLYETVVRLAACQ